MEGTVDIVTLDQKPCVVHYLDNYNKFIVATYELFSSIEDARLKLNSGLLLDDKQFRKQLERINYRAGKFILLRGNDVSLPNIEYEFECFAGGGVFDAKVKYNKSDSSYKIYAAHSNGTIGIYKLSLHCGNKICLKEHIKVNGSKMLTSIDIFPESSYTITSSSNDSSSSSSFLCSSSSQGSSVDSTSLTTTPSFGCGITTRLGSPMPTANRIVVGDSDGFITILTNGEPIRENVTQGDSIWQVKSLKLLSGKDIVIVGADNCSWYIYGIEEIEKRLILLYKNVFKDFSAGITSISILDHIHSNEYDLVEILLGSYDETLQTYQVKINHDGISKPGVCHKNTISINGGGIWRVKPYKGSRSQLCVAAMYAGSYVLSLNGSEKQQQNQSCVGSVNNDQQQQQQQQQQQIKSEEETLIKLIDTDSMKLANKPLHYDIDVSSCNTTYCIVDFNNNLCIFKTNDQ